MEKENQGHTMTRLNSVNNAIYETLGEDWYHAQDNPVALLRAETEAKWPWVQEKIHLNLGEQEGLKVLDVGCGGGFLSNRMALAKFDVTGLDLSQESLNVAKKYDVSGRAKYVYGDAYKLPFADETFAVVTAMDFLEHVEDPGLAISEMARVLKPGGVFFFHTFNRNFLAWLVVIKLVEWLVKNTPKNMHILRLFIKPRELVDFCRASGLEPREFVGIKPLFSTLRPRDLLARTVPRGFRFQLTSSQLLSYMGYSTKPRGSLPI